MTAVDLRACAILDADLLGGRDPTAAALAAARGGFTLLEVRDGRSGARLFVDSVRQIKAALAGSGVPVVVASRVDVALATAADGVSLEQADMHPVDARRLLGATSLIGITVETPAQADELYRLPVDWCWVGPVFPDDAEAEPDTRLGLNGLSRVAFRARLASGGLPVGATGGIDHGRAALVIGAGADGVAVAWQAEGRAGEEAARALRRAVERAVETRGVVRP